MFSKIPAFIAAALLLGSSSIASAAVKQTNDRVVQFDAAPVAGSYGGYSMDPQARALERLADKYNGWAEYIQ